MSDPKIIVELDGQHVPLDACCWLQRATCGCIVAITMAVSPGGRVLATADQAHAQLAPTKRERTKDLKEGLAMELITLAHYREHIATKWECPEHAPAAATSSEG